MGAGIPDDQEGGDRQDDQGHLRLLAENDSGS